MTRARTPDGSADGSRRRRTRRRLRVLEISPLVALLLLAMVWFGVPAELSQVLQRDGRWQVSGGGLTFTPAPQQAAELMVSQAPVVTRVKRRETARSYYTARRTLQWAGGAPDRDFRVAVRKVADFVARRTEVFYRSDGVPVPTALREDDPAYAPLRAWAASWNATAYAFLLPDPPQPSVVASAVTRPEWLVSPDELASLEASDTPDYLWKLRHRGTRPTFLEIATPADEHRSVGGEPRVLSSAVREVAGEYWLFISMSPGGVWVEDSEGGYWEEDIWHLHASVASSIASGTSPASDEYQDALDALAQGYRANVWVQGPLSLRAVPQIVPEGSTVQQAAKLGQAALRSAGAPGGGEVLNYRLSAMPRSEQVYAPGAKYQVLAQVVGTSTSATESNPPQTMLYVGTWSKNPYPPLAVGSLARGWDSIRAWLAANQNTLLILGFIFLGMTLVASPVSFVIDRRMTERDRVAAEMERVQRDAHDRVYNRMAALSMRLEAESSATSDPDSAAALAAVAADLADTRRDLREILGDARAASAEGAAKTSDPGAMVADQLAALVAAQRSMTGISIKLDADPKLPPIAPEAGWDLQCITEEAISNAIRHGDATEVRVTIAKEPSGVQLEIKDNGGSPTPIDVDSLPVGSTGLRGMRARAERLGGSLEVRSDQTGVTVVVHVPERPNRRFR